MEAIEIEMEALKDAVIARSDGAIVHHYGHNDEDLVYAATKKDGKPFFQMFEVHVGGKEVDSLKLLLAAHVCNGVTPGNCEEDVVAQQRVLDYLHELYLSHEILGAMNLENMKTYAKNTKLVPQLSFVEGGDDH